MWAVHLAAEATEVLQVGKVVVEAVYRSGSKEEFVRVPD
jgi:hypothetical protein